MRDGRTVAIKCMQRQEFNAIGEQEAAILRQISATDSDGHCPGVCVCVCVSCYCNMCCLAVCRTI